LQNIAQHSHKQLQTERDNFNNFAQQSANQQQQILALQQEKKKLSQQLQKRTIKRSRKTFASVTQRKPD
jgi:cell shape-determining protein MreC